MNRPNLCRVACSGKDTPWCDTCANKNGWPQQDYTPREMELTEMLRAATVRAIREWDKRRSKTAT